MARQLRRSAACLNCGQLVASRFCSECGQENTDYRVSLGRLLGDLFEEVFQIESRLWRSLWDLLRHPGRLTREYNAGRRVRYTTPLRLYLLASVSYFFIGSLRPASDTIQVDLGKPGEMQQQWHPSSKLERKLYDKVAEVQRDPKAAARRARQALSDYVPKVLAVLVPLFALLTMLFFRRPKRFYVEHLVFALHAHAAGFLILLVGALIRSGWLSLLLLLGLAVWLSCAARELFGQSWARVSWKLILLGLVYSIFVAVGVTVALLVGVFAG